MTVPPGNTSFHFLQGSIEVQLGSFEVPISLGNEHRGKSIASAHTFKCKLMVFHPKDLLTFISMEFHGVDSSDHFGISICFKWFWGMDYYCHLRAEASGPGKPNQPPQIQLSPEVGSPQAPEPHPASSQINGNEHRMCTKIMNTRSAPRE